MKRLQSSALSICSHDPWWFSLSLWFQCAKFCCFCNFLNLFFIWEFELIILSVQDSELMTCSALGGAVERGEAGGGWKSHLIANKSQNTLKNCCFSFTFQTYTDTAGAGETIPSSKSWERRSSATQKDGFRLEISVSITLLL